MTLWRPEKKSRIVEEVSQGATEKKGKKLRRERKYYLGEKGAMGRLWDMSYGFWDETKTGVRKK